MDPYAFESLSRYCDVIHLSFCDNVIHTYQHIYSVQSYLIITGRCVGAGLELTSAGGIPESRVSLRVSKRTNSAFGSKNGNFHGM